MILVLSHRSSVEAARKSAVSRRNQWEHLAEILGGVRFPWGKMHCRRMRSLVRGVVDKYGQKQKRLIQIPRRSFAQKHSTAFYLKRRLIWKRSNEVKSMPLTSVQASAVSKAERARPWFYRMISATGTAPPPSWRRSQAERQKRLCPPMWKSWRKGLKPNPPSCSNKSGR